MARLSEDDARALLESIRWPNGPVCPHCGETSVTRLNGDSARPGLFQCNAGACREQFTVTVGTIFEDSHIPLHKWVIAFGLMCSSKKGISALQLQRKLGLGSYKTAWHHICEPFMSTTLEATFCCMTRSRRIDMVIEGDVHEKESQICILAEGGDLITDAATAICAASRGVSRCDLLGFRRLTGSPDRLAAAATAGSSSRGPSRSSG